MEKEILENVPEQYKFLLANGKEVRGIKELHGMLKSMEENVFYSHVNESKNDFYNWVKDIYQDKKVCLMICLKDTQARELLKKLKQILKSQSQLQKES